MMLHAAQAPSPPLPYPTQIRVNADSHRYIAKLVKLARPLKSRIDA